MQENAAVDATKVIVMGYVKTPKVSESGKRLKNTVVVSIGYDYEGLVRTTGKSIPDYSLGSALVSITSFASQVESASEQPGNKIAVNCEATLAGNGDCPCFAAPNPSTALQLKDNSTYSMLSQGLCAPADPGLAFEGWIKVTKVTETVVVAYTSERSPLSEGMSNDYQTFVLAIPTLTAPSADRYQLACNANGCLLSIKDDDAFQVNKWFHFACSVHNSLSLNFSGSNYVDLGTAAEFNLQDFSIAFTLQLWVGGRDQIVLTKQSDASGGDAPIHIEVTNSNRLRLVFWAKDENGAKETAEKHSYTSEGSTLEVGKAYKVFISREYMQIKRTNESPRWAQCVTMKAWDAADGTGLVLTPPSVQELVEGEKSAKTTKISTDGAAQASGVASSNTAVLYLGGAPWSTSGLSGTIGFLRLYSAPVRPVPKSSSRFCTANISESGLVASWSGQSGETKALADDTGRNHGKLKKEPKWVRSPFAPDHRVGVYVNGVHKTTSTASETRALERPAGPHQLTLGNVIKENNQDARFLLYDNSFEGEVSCLRWSV